MDPTAGANATAPPPLPPNFFDKKPLVNEPGTLIGVTVVFMILVIIATSARMYVRMVIAKAPGWDDLFLVLAAIHVFIGVIATCVGTKYGLGQHIYLLSPSDLRSFLICHWLLGLSYVSSTAFIKLSLLCQYLRIFEKGTFIYHATIILAGVIGLWGFAFTFMGWFACFPSPAAFWNQTGKGCYASFDPEPAVVIKTIEGHAGANVAFDFMVLALAFRLLWEKNGPINKRGLAALLLLGLVGCAFGLWRMIEVIIAEAGAGGFDITWDEPMPQLLTVIEVCIACLCATTPFFWPLLKEGWDKIMVKFEFDVVTESRWHDNHIELAYSNPAKEALDREVSTGSYDEATRDMRSTTSGGYRSVSPPSTETHYRNPSTVTAPDGYADGSTGDSRYFNTQTTEEYDPTRTGQVDPFLIESYDEGNVSRGTTKKNGTFSAV